MKHLLRNHSIDLLSSALIYLGCLLCAVPAHAGSIFDFDEKDYSPPAKPSAPQSLPQNVTPSKSTPEARPPIATPVVAPGRDRLPLPALTDRQASENLLKALFEKELADRAPPARRALAQQLIAKAAATADVPSDQFVLLVGARQAAEDAVDLSLCVRAIDAMANRFEIDPLRLKSRSAMKAAVKLPLLAKASDATFKDLATLELSVKDSQTDKLSDVGDRWWTRAETQPELARSTIRAHAVAIYTRAMPGALGLRREIMAKRIADVNAADSGHAIDLLAMIDPARDAIVGTWARQASGLTVRDGEFTRVQIPYQPPEEYDLRVDFTYATKGGPINLICPLGDGAVIWNMEFNGNRFDTNHGKIAPGNKVLIQRGLPCSAIVKVRRGHVQGYLNGTLLSEFDRTATPLDIPNNWKLRNDHALGLAVWASETIFTRAELLEVSGPGKRLPVEK